MPRVIIFLFLSWLLFFPLNNTKASTEQQTFYLNKNIKQKLSLPDNSFELFFTKDILTKNTRVNMAKIPTIEVLNKPKEAINYIYSWQILDAQLTGIISVFINDDFNKNIDVFSRENNEWQKIKYEREKNKIILQVKNMHGLLAIVENEKVIDENKTDFIESNKINEQEEYIIKSSDSLFSLNVLPGAFLNKIKVDIKKLPVNNYNKFSKLDLISNIYYLHIETENNENIKKDLPIDIKYFNKKIDNKNIYYWDGDNWQLSPSRENYQQGSVRTFTHQKDVILAIFTDKIMQKGKASWYRWKNGNFAASPDYPKGTKLRVTNLDNSKSVIITVNDYGPDRSIYPDRIIDLDRVAFAKIANPNQGIISVMVEKI